MGHHRLHLREEGFRLVPMLLAAQPGGPQKYEQEEERVV
jgi:hypothetical protein